MSRRWAVYDQHGRLMIGGWRTRFAARRWLRDVQASNPRVCAGWEVAR